MSRCDGWCVWLTGLPGSGKSTIANMLLELLRTFEIHAQILSSDMLRKVVTPSPKYTEEERDMVYGAIVFTSMLLTQNNINTIVDATANRRRYRDLARQKIPKYVEAYIRCPIDVCIQRESKRKENAFFAPNDIYKKAKKGESFTVPGIGVPYEEPLNPEVTVDSDRLTPKQCAERILKNLLNYRKSDN